MSTHPKQASCQMGASLQKRQKQGKRGSCRLHFVRKSSLLGSPRPEFGTPPKTSGQQALMGGSGDSPGGTGHCAGA
jgi:hypothetical protein